MQLSLHFNLLTRQGHRIWTRVACLLAVCFLGGGLYCQQSLRVAAAKRQPVPVMQPEHVRVLPAPELERQQLAVQAAQRQASVPWLLLLDQLERLPQPGIYWTAILPDAQRQHVAFAFVSQTRQQGWALVAQLKRCSVLQQVRVKNQMRSATEGPGYTRFEVEAQWQF